MSWFKVDDGFHSHPKVIEAGNEAIGLWVRCGSYCARYLTEGYVPRNVALLYGDISLIETLVKIGMFTPVDGGWVLHDYLDYNPTKGKVVADREAAAKRQREARERSKKAREAAASKAATRQDSNASSHGVTNNVVHMQLVTDEAEHHGVTDAFANANAGMPTVVLEGAPEDFPGHDVSDETSRRDSRQPSPTPRPDPTRTYYVSDENPSSSETATPPPDEQPTTKSRRKTTKTAPKSRADVEALCSRLVELMVENECNPPEITKAWRNAARLMLDKDKRDFDKAMGLLEWCQQDEFWHSNIHSMPTFRRQYEKLRQKANAEWRRNQATGIPAASGAEVEIHAGNNVVAIHPNIPTPRPSTTDRAVASGDTALAEFRRMTGRTA